MKIISLQANNIKRLKAVEIRPDGSLVELTGRNRQGKSSTLDAIWWALGGTRDIPSSPIRRGETEASIHLDLGAYRVTRTFKLQDDGSHTTYLKVEDANGGTFSKQQDVLNALVGDLTFDPLAFTTMKAADQVDIVKRFIPDFDFAADDRAQKGDYEKRTEVNRQAKELRAQASTIQLPPDVPDATVDEAPILEGIQTASSRNAELEQMRNERAAEGRQIQRLQDDAVQKFAAADAARREAKRLEDEATALTEQAVDRQALLDSLVAVAPAVDTSELAAKLQEAQTKNAAFAQAQRRRQLEAQAEAKETESKALTKAMEDREANRRRIVAQAKMPIPGLGFSDGEVMLNGLPLEQASDAEQLRASVAIAAAMNPRLRVIRVRDGSRLDSEAMQILADFATEMDLQIWVETVEGNRASAVVIEDGQVVEPTLLAAE